MRPDRLARFTVLATMTACAAPTSAQFPGSPDSAEIVTDDIDRFWQAFDQRVALGGEVAFERLYLEVGSPGLLDFVPDRIQSAARLAEAIADYESFYIAIRPQTLQVREFEADIRASLEAMERVYPESVFPPLYFVIGRVTSAGHATGNGLIIGTEFLSTSAETALEALDPGVAEVLRTLSPADLPYVVVHELVHFQQAQAEMEGRSLLGQALYEGVADFVGELVTGGLAGPNERTRQFGDQHESEIWQEFQSVMLARNYSRWLYNQGRGTADWPADIGYYVGYKIAAAYYEGSSDPRLAIREMLRIEDPEAFLADSGYGEDLID